MLIRNGQVRPQGPLMAPDHFLMAPDSGYAIARHVYSSYVYTMWPASPIIILYFYVLCMK